MLNISNENSLGFRKIINDILEEAILMFIEFGSNLNYREICADAFPLHLREDEGFVMSNIKRLHNNIIDEYNHSVSSLDRYMIYNILYFCYEDLEHEESERNILLNFINENINKRELNEEEAALFLNINSLEDILFLCLEDDLDFLYIPLYFQIYKTSPDFVNIVMGIDLDYYKDIVPEDIFREYQIQKNKCNGLNQCKSTKIENQEQFKEVIINCIKKFQFRIINKKLLKLSKFKDKVADESDVQILFYSMADQMLEEYDIVICPETDTMRGLVDFHLSFGRKYQALIELKLDTNPNKKDGIDYQLLMYTIAQEVDFGIFVLICFDDESYNEAEQFFHNARKVSKENKKDIRFARIDASGNYKTGSKIKSLEEIKLRDPFEFNN